MRIVKLKTTKFIALLHFGEKTDIFEIVEKIPVGFFVWNSVKTWEHMNIFQFAKIYTQKTKTITRSTRQHLKP